MKDLIEAYKKEAEVLDNEFLRLFSKKMDLIREYKSNAMLSCDNFKDDLSFATYEGILKIFKKHNYKVIVDDYVKKFNGRDDDIYVTKHVFYFNHEVEEFCKKEMINKIVYLNVDENINSNVFLGIVVRFKYEDRNENDVTLNDRSDFIDSYSDWTIHKMLEE